MDWSDHSIGGLIARSFTPIPSSTRSSRIASTIHGDRDVLTARGPGQISRVSYREVGERAARLANALREIGIRGDERVATLQWSNQEHLDAYAAVQAALKGANDAATYRNIISAEVPSLSRYRPDAPASLDAVVAAGLPSALAKRPVSGM